MNEQAHCPVLLAEAVDVLQPAPGTRVVDATFGRGGHTRGFLSAGACVLALDRDPEAVAAGERLVQEWGKACLEVRKMNFGDIGTLTEERGKLDGLFLDLGVSSPQLDCPERGFSFQEEGPLDMRMDPEGPVTAADLVNEASFEELSDWFWRYGDERQSRRVARAICQDREKARFETTLQLAAMVESVVGAARRGKLHPATKVFQALRIVVNGELEALERALAAAPALLKPGGRLAVISFHALEDRRVKHFIRHHSQEEIRGEASPFGKPNPDHCLKDLGRWKPSEVEIAANPRARSARLRAAEKLGKLETGNRKAE